MTYRPGASSSGGCLLLPSTAGAGVILPERALIHSSQCGHQLPPCFGACSSHASALALSAGRVQKNALGFPGGLSRLWMWPLLASTKVVCFPQSLAVL